MAKLLKKIFGSRNERILRRYGKIVTAINELETAIKALSDNELRAKTDEFRQRYQNGENLDDLLAEAFAVVRETANRVLKMRHFDVQLVGGMVLHDGKISEMRTGEGKTLVATLPAYLNAITGKGVHIITVNDYLAQRDAKWMEPVYEFLGLTTGVILSDMRLDPRRAAYACDITYGTNNEFGFDYLRDNMAFNPEDRVQRPLNYAIVDEVDSILIDEARTPLIISGPSDESSEMYHLIDGLIPKLIKQEQEDGPGDYSVDEKSKQAYLTEEGHLKVEELLTESGLLNGDDSLYDAANISLMHHVNAALRAHALFHKDVDYIVKNDDVIIVDEHTGRTMPGRRWSDGLHQAVEAKEGVKINAENQTLASITFQNYFRLYEKLAGMTGTADTEAYEFQQIYGLEVVVIPTNKPMIRIDAADKVYLTKSAKFKAIINDIKNCRERGQPVLVGTISIETSEYLSNLLNREKISHKVLNAKFHAQEAEIIAEAGRPGTVTIATNMAGRGTDIVLGGNLAMELAEKVEKAKIADVQDEQAAIETAWDSRHGQVIQAGGLRVIGTERHESRRIDNQLRGRSGRQGDPGASQFYLSLEDDLMRIFASDRLSGMMRRLGLQEDEPIEHNLVTKAIENAQRKVEGHNFDIRKQLLEYDDVANEQRQVIYQQRNELMSMNEFADAIAGIREDVVTAVVDNHIPPQSLVEQWDVQGLEEELQNVFAIEFPVQNWLDEDETLDEEGLRQKILVYVNDFYSAKWHEVAETDRNQIEKSIMLQTLDQQWREHLAVMDHLRQGIHLRGYAQKNPKQEYKRESFDLFARMLDRLKLTVIKTLCHMNIQTVDENALDHSQSNHLPFDGLEYHHADAESALAPVLSEEAVSAIDEAHPVIPAEKVAPFIRKNEKVGRNALCPCGSGRKYKHCHGQYA